MAIPPRFLNELRDRVLLSEVIGRRIKVTRAGREFKACCPFHYEKTPSFTINDDKQFYHCFGCGAHGSAIDFVMQNDNLSFPEAVELLASQAGMQVPKQSPQEVAQAKKEKSLYSLLDDTTKFFQQTLRDSKNGDAQRYLSERGIGSEIAEAFQIGFSPVDGGALYQYLKAREYTDAQMIDAGVMRKSTRGGDPYAFFRDRVMFPVTDKRGRVVAFGGRVLPDHMRPPDQSGNTPPKYINSSDTPLFHKGQMLYGGSQARQAAVDGQNLIVVEGYLDVIACFEFGFKGAVAPLGTALTEEQIQNLWRMIPSGHKAPILCFDGDNAGQRAAARAAERLLPLLKPDHSALFAFLPDGQDPDSLLRERGKKAFQAVLDSAMPLVDFIWRYHTAGKSLRTPEERAGLSKILDDEALRIPDRTIQHYYRQAFREQLYQNFGPQKRAGNSAKNAYVTNKTVESSLTRLRKPAVAQRLQAQKIMLATIINHPAIFSDVEDELSQMDIAQERLDLLKQNVLNLLADEPGLDPDSLRTYLNKNGFEAELSVLLSEALYVHAGFARPNDNDQDALSGWQGTMSLLHETALGLEVKEAGRALATNFSEENEQRVLALQSMKKISDG